MGEMVEATPDRSEEFNHILEHGSAMAPACFFPMRLATNWRSAAVPATPTLRRLLFYDSGTVGSSWGPAPACTFLLDGGVHARRARKRDAWIIFPWVVLESR